MGSLIRWTLILVVVLGLGTATARAANIEGTLQWHAAKQMDTDACQPGIICGTPFNEQRLQVKFDDTLAGANVFGKLDVANDTALGDTLHEVRELYVDNNWSSASIRAGRQIISWGVGDLLFINDVFPKNFNALFSGQPIEYLKRGSDAIKLDIYPRWGNVEFVVAQFRADITPDPRRFIIEGVPATTPRTDDVPTDGEAAIKLSRMIGNWDAAAYAYRGYFRAPAFTANGGALAGRHPRLNTVGASLVGPGLGGVISAEIGYYDSVEDRTGTDAATDNNQTKALIGYTRAIAEDTTLGAQFFVEYLDDYSGYRQSLPTGATPRDRSKETATVRFTQRYLRQTLTFNVFGFWGVSDRDSYVIPSLRYAFTDKLIGEIGANIFSGRASGTFGSLDRNDNVYAFFRYSF